MIVPKRVFASFFIAMTIIIIISSLAYYNISGFRGSHQWVSHTFQVLGQIKVLISDVKDIESGARYYLLTNKEDFLSQYYAGLNKTDNDLSNLHKLISDNPGQINRFNNLAKLIQEKKHIHKKQIDILKTRGFKEAVAYVSSGAGIKSMDQIKLAADEMQRIEENLLLLRVKDVNEKTYDILIITGILIFLLTGSIIAAIFFMRKDILEKNKRTNTLQESLNFSDMIISTIPMPLLVLNKELQIINANRAFRLMFNLNKDELEDKQFFEIIKGNFNVPELKKELCSIIPENSVVENKEIEINGNKIIKLNARKLYREFNNVYLILAGLEDITEKKKFETEREELLSQTNKALNEAEEAKNYFKSIFESSPGLYLVLSPEEDLPIVGVSEEYLKATKTKRNEIIGKKMFEIFPDDPNLDSADGVRNLKASYERVKQNKAPDVMGVQRYPIRKPPEEGGGFEDRYWSPINSPVLDNNGKLIYIIHRVEDVTDYILNKKNVSSGAQNADAILEKKQEYIEADIVLRSQELMRLNDKLRVTQKELERSNKELEQYASVISHDLNSPLYSVTGFSEMLKNKYKDKLDVSAEEYLNYIIESSKRMRLLIDNLLEYSRITSGEKKFKEINTAILLDNVLKNLQKLIDETNTNIIFNSLPVIWGDEYQILRLFQNLLENAIKFRKTNALPVIEISHSDKNSEWLFSIKDNGIGIDPKNLDKIFQIFQYFHENEDYAGTGIGLAECKKIVENHGGHIWAESVLGAGSTFYFTLLKKNAI